MTIEQLLGGLHDSNARAQAAQSPKPVAKAGKSRRQKRSGQTS